MPRGTANGAFTVPIGVTINGPTTGPKGSPVSFSSNIVGPTGTATNNWSVVASNGQVISSATTATYGFTPVNIGTYVVTDNVTDSANPADNGIATQTLTVTDVAPTVTWTANPATANEGTTSTYSFTTSDPGSGQPYTLQTPTATGGTVSSINFNPTTGAGTFNVTWTAAGSETVSVVVADDHGTNSTPATTQTVAVAPVAPTVTLSGALSANEGDTKTYTITATDPGVGDTFASPTVSVTGGTYNSGSLVWRTTAGTGTFTVTFNNPLPATTPATISATVKDSATDNLLTGTSNTLSVAVAPVAPVVQWLTDPLTANEGDTKTYTFRATDVGPNDTFSIASVTAAGGTVTAQSIQNTAGTATGSFSVLFNQGVFSGSTPITSLVSVTIADNAANNGLSSTPPTSATVTVTPIAPVVNWTVNPSAANEGQTLLYTFTATDTDILDTLSYASLYPSATDGTVTNATITPTATTTTANATGSFNVTFNQPGSANVSVKVADNTTGMTSGTLTQPVTVTAVPPTVVLSGATAANEGDIKTYTITATDPGLPGDTFASPTVTVNEELGGVSAVGGTTTGYTNGQVVTLSGGTFTTAATVTLAVSGGVVTGAVVNNSGNSSAAPTSPVSVSTGGLTLTCNFSPAYNSGSLVWSPTAGTGTFTVTFNSATATASPATISVSDKDSTNNVTSTSNTLSVPVAAVAPTVTLSSLNPTSANEGQTQTFTFTATTRPLRHV